MSRTYVKFAAPKEPTEGSSKMEENWQHCIQAGKLWAEWGHALDDENRALCKAYAGDFFPMKSISLPGNHRTARPGRHCIADSWAIWTLMKVIYGKDKMLGNNHRRTEKNQADSHPHVRTSTFCQCFGGRRISRSRLIPFSMRMTLD
jgi:hypothetical protein